MIDALIGLLVLVLVLGIVIYVVKLIIDMIPMDARFKQIAWLLLILIAVLILLARALPLLGISAGI